MRTASRGWSIEPSGVCGVLDEEQDKLLDLIERLRKSLTRRAIQASERSPDTLFGELLFLNVVLELKERARFEKSGL
jgi:hypothetical protein